MLRRLIGTGGSFLAVLACGMLAASPAAAEVRESSDTGFVVQLGLDVPAAPAETWSALLAPARWWNPENTFSRNADNLSLDARAGGCFCEILPNKASPNAAPRGSVEHMRVIYVERPRALRMSGALGPLQAGAGTGTLTIILNPHEAGTRILWEYVYGGYLRGGDVKGLAASTNAMLADQLLRLGRQLGAGAQDSGPMHGPDNKPAQPSDDDAFAKEMLGGIQGGASEARALPEVQTQREPKAPSREPGFIGR